MVPEVFRGGSAGISICLLPLHACVGDLPCLLLLDIPDIWDFPGTENCNIRRKDLQNVEKRNPRH